MSSPPQSTWPTTRRTLLIVGVLVGGMSLYSLTTGRPGDFGAGMVGMVLGATAGLMVALVEVIGRWLARRRSAKDPDPEASTPPASDRE